MTPEHTPDHTSLSTAMAVKPGTFAYTGLDPKSAEDLRKGADHIRRMTNQTSKCLLAIGDELTRAKNLLLHGQFGTWLATEFGWSERTAQRYMKATEVFGSKNDTVSVLEPTAIYQLSAKSTPENVRHAIVTRLKAGERPVLAEVNAEVRQARQTAVKEKAAKAEGASAWRAGLPLPLPAVTRARRAAGFILERLGEERGALSELLQGIDSKELLAALLKGEIPAVPRQESPQPLRSVDL
ncbi:DUF3102 domain-containing protein [Methylobacterium sp. J-026]|uniref:DUF3102 domain-containing protein n=1 Tax=Methylobacterium sp. J-026 TaxID=2836624 RepID=UPI001FBBA1F4|nr:DUF3102 domain-containing protein [Methylobacterium sp. J-026]MCJ2134036.1 DUF3102 domain-containing protein [Methylobacterium sp. J-026]